MTKHASNAVAYKKAKYSDEIPLGQYCQPLADAVILAPAGIQVPRDTFWIPAYAGMTMSFANKIGW